MIRKVEPYPLFHRITFLAAVIAVIVLNWIFNKPDVLGKTTGEVSDLYKTLITPADYAFSIWSLIYTTLLVFGIFQYIKGREVGFYMRIWPWFLISAAANVGWLVVFQLELLGLSVLVILVMLYALIRIYKIFRWRIRSLNTTRRYLFQVPFSLFFSWTIVATIINIAVWLRYLELDFFLSSEVLWSVLMMVIITGLGILFLFKYKDYVFPLVFAWALLAIGIEHKDFEAIQLVGKISAGILVGVSAVTFAVFINNRYKIH